MSTILAISEISSDFIKRNIRIYGKIAEAELGNNRVKISHLGHAIWVDTTLIGPFAPSRTALWMLIGELGMDPLYPSLPILFAKIMKNVQDLDLRILEKVLEKRSKTLQLGFNLAVKT